MINMVLISFMHDFLQFAQTKLIKRLINILLVCFFAVFIVHNIYIYFGEVRTIKFWDIILYLLPFYAIILFFLKNKNAKNKTVEKMIRLIIIISMILVPILLLENFDISLNIKIGNNSFLSFKLLLFPFHYLIINLIFIYFGLKHYHLLVDIQANDFQISTEFVKKFNITEREIQLIKLLSKGYNNKEMAEILFISPATVRNHLHNIYEKTGASNRVELIGFCIQ